MGMVIDITIKSSTNDRLKVYFQLDTKEYQMKDIIDKMETAIVELACRNYEIKLKNK